MPVKGLVPAAMPTATDGRLPTLVVGQSFVIRVLENLPENLTLIDLKGMRVLADGLACVSPGTQLQVSVKQLTPKPVLQLSNGLTVTPRLTPQPQGQAAVLPDGVTIGADGRQQINMMLPNARTVGVALLSAAPTMSPGMKYAAIVTELSADGKNAILDVGGAKVELSGVSGLGKGDVLGATVIKSGQQLAMALSPTQSAETMLTGLADGAKVRATLVERLPEGGALVTSAGRFYLAEVPDDIAPGQGMLMKVASSGGEKFLEILGQAMPADIRTMKQFEQTAMQYLRGSGVAGGTVGQTLANLVGELATVIKSSQPGVLAGHTTTSPAAADPAVMEKLAELTAKLTTADGRVTSQTLEEFVRNGGLSYEGKFAAMLDASRSDIAKMADGDAKALLMSLLGKTADQPALPQPSSLLAAAENHLRSIENQQLANVVSQSRGGPIWLEIPIASSSPSGGDAATIPMLITPDRQSFAQDADGDGKSASGDQSGKKGVGHTVLFLLNMESLGKIRVDAHVKDESVRAIFYVDDYAAQEKLSAAIPSLTERFTAIGYDSPALLVRLARLAPPEKDKMFDTLQRGTPMSNSAVDVRV